MRMPYFIFRDRDSREKGLVVSRYPALIKPKERVTELVIPGRGGSLSLKEGEEVFEPFVLSFNCILMPEADFDAVKSWLRGQGRLILGSAPDRFYRARADAQISFDKMIRGSQRRDFVIPFSCQPWQEAVSLPPVITLTQSGSAVTNPGTLSLSPRVTLRGNGDGSLMMGGKKLDIRGMEGGMVLEGEMLDARSLTGLELINDKISGDFPRLAPGVNLVSFTGGITSVEIAPEWRWI